ncbi:hypothetical protein [Rhodocyclus gracilis]|uniref:Uncharacterized protein n=1 Tax=Rhodocyclus tenuis TaxID=1066 RepID=A0A6L5JU07_RHOTE|nr:hypothetical protein [Rhodocyclus gracilis]MQY50847.1 hypothetical protein [Rhodocyclus gracilis]
METDRKGSAAAAIRAAQNLKRWGWFATLRYCAKNRVSAELFATAQDFEARRKS